MDAITAGRSLEQALDGLAHLLVEHGQCDLKTLERARRVAAESGQRLDSVMIQLGLVSERGLAEGYAALLGTRLVTPDRYPDEALFPERLTTRFLRTARAMPIGLEDGVLLVAATDPLDPFTQSSIAAATGKPVVLEVAVPIEIEAAFDRLYRDENAPQETGGHGEHGDGPLEEDAERLKDLASEAPVIRLVNQMISRAVETQASDIHVEPFEDRLRVRYRYDGVLQEAESPPVRLTAAITSRVKIMAKLDIAERRLPQDGRIRMAVRGQEVDFRVSTIPSLHGEKVVMRILDRTAVAFDYAKLGLPASVIARLSTALNLPNGIVLVTGPTGSGKTTTLYSGLLALNSTTRNVITVEDPIEYQLRGVNQIQVKSQIGLTFATLLRSILRQDPDVIMVGEIRDLETAQIAVQAALTGHLVLSTLHTNSAAATITRLRDMGLEDYLLTAVLRGVLAQRLVRRLCPACKREVDAPPEVIERFDLARLSPRRPPTIWHPVGCPQCRGTGYKGRLAIAEFLHPDAAVERLIFAHADHADIERAAAAGGMETMFDAGLAAALEGVTTIEEVMRSIRAAGVMPSFRYTAITPAGETTRGVLEAASEAAVIEQLRKQGNIPVRAEVAASGFLAHLLAMEFGPAGRLKRQDVANITRELSIMLGAGQDLDRALRFLVDTAPNQRVRAVMDRLRADVRDGTSLATALSRHPNSFPRLYVGLVRAGEAGGTLAATLDRLALLLERERSLTATIQSALIYPALLIVASIGAIALLLTQVLPQFVPLFEQNGAALPRPTQILISVGDFATNYGLYVLVAVMVGVLAIRQALQRPPIRLRADRVLLHLPVVGRLAREAMAARFSRTLGTLVGNGMPLIGALDIVRETLGNLAAVSVVEAATQSAKGGAGLSRPLGESGLFPVRTIYLLRLGEETAQLGPMALRAAEIHEENTRLGVQRLVSLLVPVITIAVGAIIAGIVASLLLAMLSLNDLAN